MPKYAEERERLDLVFAALADPTRRRIVERLSAGPAATSRLAEGSGMALPSFHQHLDVLERAGVVTSHKAGRVRSYQLAVGPLKRASDWLAGQRNHWVRRADQLDHVLTDQESPS